MTDITARCDRGAQGWRCDVQVESGGGTSSFDVTARDPGPFLPTGSTGPAAAEIERLVTETFRFLLEREPVTSILSSFDLTVVARYFPEYPSEIRRRLGDTIP